MNIVKEEGEKKLGKILYYKFHDKLIEEEKKNVLILKDISKMVSQIYFKYFGEIIDISSYCIKFLYIASIELNSIYDVIMMFVAAAVSHYK